MTEEITNNGFISLHRKIFEWEWYTDLKTFKLFVHCLLKANFKKKHWRGYTIERGQFITSREQLSIETGLTIQEVRTALKHLKLTNEITNATTQQNRVITVINYDLYQRQVTNEITNKQPTSNQQVTTTNNDNNDNNENKSLSCKNQKTLSGEDEIILKGFINKQTNIKNKKAYQKTLINNGSAIEIIEQIKEEKLKEQIKKEKKQYEKEAKKQYEKEVKNFDEYTEKEAISFVSKLPKNFRKTGIAKKLIDKFNITFEEK